MTVYGLNKQKFYDNLRYALDEETFESFADAPFDWLLECYMDIHNYGGSYWHVKRVLDSWADKTDNRGMLFGTAASYREKLLQYDPMLMSVYSREEVSQRNVAAIRVSSLRNDFFYLAIETRGFTWDALPEISKGLLALQYRHTINLFSEFTMEDYNALTEFIRKYWGPIHPDDDPVLGMVNFPHYHYHSPPIDDSKVLA